MENQERENHLRALQTAIKSIDELKEQVSKLQAFKDYVHKRLDDVGIEKDPESPHKKAGCRIGGRLDIVLSHFAGGKKI